MVAKQVVVEESIPGQAPPPGQSRRAVPLSSDDQFNLSAFGDYSESFSFDVGCGLPGRVYHMGVPTWEQSVHNAPLHHFERVGGSVQWGIRTVVCIPVPVNHQRPRIQLPRPQRKRRRRRVPAPAALVLTHSL